MSAWTQERTDQAVSMWSEGQSATTISKVLKCGLSRSAVVGKMQRMGLARPPEVSRVAMQLSAVRWVRAKQAAAGAVLRLGDVDLPGPTVTHTPHARPWTTRRFGECAFPVGGEGAEMRSCCAPGIQRRAGAAAYCDAHNAAMFSGRPEPKPASWRRRGPDPDDLDVSVLPDWDAA